MSMKPDARIAYGFWRYGSGDLELALKMIERAREAGVVHFDTADVYGGRERLGAAETLLGEVRKTAPSLLQGALIATKVGVEFGTPYNSSKAYIANAVNTSLRRLGVDRIDLIYIHRPDLLAHPEEVAEALDMLVKQGKASSIGVSNYAPAQIDALLAYLDAPLAALQIEFSVLNAAALFDGTIDQAMVRKIPLYAWSPLAGGRLFSGGDEHALRVRPVLEALAAEKDAGADAVALAFILRHPARIIPIIGTKNPARLANAIAASAIELTRAEWYRILEASLGRRMP
jgi:predicted oxidoreductase